MVVIKKKEKEKPIDKKAEFFKELRVLETISVVCEGEVDGKPIQARIFCPAGEKVDKVLETIAAVKVATFERAMRR